MSEKAILPPRAKDITGMTFKNWLVIRFVGKRKNVLLWECECLKCNKIYAVSGGGLRKLNSHFSCFSCHTKGKRIVKNVYIEKNGYYELLISHNRYDGDYTILIDKNDYDLIKDFSWRINKNYGETKIQGVIVGIHRVIMGVIGTKMLVDHIDHNTLDNRRFNLRVCTHQENMFNTKKKIPTSSGLLKGVTYYNGRWRARITFNKKLFNLGTFPLQTRRLTLTIRRQKNCLVNLLMSTNRREILNEMEL